MATKSITKKPTKRIKLSAWFSIGNQGLPIS